MALKKFSSPSSSSSKKEKELMEQEKLILAKDTDQRFSDERGKKLFGRIQKLNFFAPRKKCDNCENLQFYRKLFFIGGRLIENERIQNELQC